MNRCRVNLNLHDIVLFTLEQLGNSVVSTCWMVKLVWMNHLFYTLDPKPIQASWQKNKTSAPTNSLLTLPIWVLINFNFKIFYLFWTSLTPNFNQILISFLFFFTNSFFEFLVIYFFLIFDNLLFMHCFVLCTTTLVDHSKTGQTGQFVILSDRTGDFRLKLLFLIFGY